MPSLLTKNSVPLELLGLSRSLIAAFGRRRGGWSKLQALSVIVTRRRCATLHETQGAARIVFIHLLFESRSWFPVGGAVVLGRLGKVGRSGR